MNTIFYILIYLKWKRCNALTLSFKCMDYLLMLSLLLFFSFFCSLCLLIFHLLELFGCYLENKKKSVGLYLWFYHRVFQFINIFIGLLILNSSIGKVFFNRVKSKTISIFIHALFTFNI